VAKLQNKKFDSPDKRDRPGRGTVDVVELGGITARRLTLPPGWRWSEDVKPVAKTDSCQIPHHNIHISGRLHVVMDDGTEDEFGPGDISLVPPGHDAWVVGNEPAVMIEQTPPQ
jgi:hypothetical protein